jgi:hypothetical protein
MRKGAYLNVADGFNVAITEDSHNPAYEMVSEADEEDANGEGKCGGLQHPVCQSGFAGRRPLTA